MSGPQFTIFGNKYHMGSYILLIRVSSPIELAFGRFQQGRVFAIPKGDYLYIGSALGEGTPLAHRLCRHASRSGIKPNHKIRAVMMHRFVEEELMEKDAKKISDKKLRWHIDYLLDRTEAEITHVVIIRSPIRLEQKLSDFLDSLQETSAIAPRLGAQDARSGTHILCITSGQRILELVHRYLSTLDPVL